MGNISNTCGLDDLKKHKLMLKRVFAEFIGTFLFLSIALIGTGPSTVVTTALMNGLLVASVVQIIGHISGGHINPAVTLGALIGGYIKILPAVLYIAAQVLAAVVAFVLAYAMSFEVLHVRSNLKALRIFGLEILYTALLIAVVLSVCDMRRFPRGLGIAPMAIGLSVTACQCANSYYIGSLNPAASLASALLLKDFEHLWMHWAGQFVGAILAALVYRFALPLRSRALSTNNQDLGESISS